MTIDSLRNKERELFLRKGEVAQEEARELLQELGKQCANVEYEEDYAWINEAVIRWESYLKSQYDELYLTPLTIPQRSLTRRLPDARSLFWPLYRPILQLFAHFILTEPSSERVATVFANLVSHLLEAVDTLDEDHRKTITELAELAQPVRHSLRQLAKYVMSNIDDRQALRTHLAKFLDTERALPDKIHAVFKSNLKKFGIVPSCGILIYGYSELMEPALRAIPDKQRKAINVFVSKCSFAWQRADGPLAERMAKSLCFPTQQVDEEKIGNLIDTEKPATVLMGCRSVGTNGNGSIEVNALQGSRKVSARASKNGSKICILLGKRKILNPKLFQRKSLPMRTDLLPTITMVSSRWVKQGKIGMPTQNRIPGEHIDFFVTEDGAFTGDEFTNKYRQKLYQQS